MTFFIHSPALILEVLSLEVCSSVFKCLNVSNKTVAKEAVAIDEVVRSLPEHMNIYKSAIASRSCSPATIDFVVSNCLSKERDEPRRCVNLAKDFSKISGRPRWVNTPCNIQKDVIPWDLRPNDDNSFAYDALSAAFARLPVGEPSYCLIQPIIDVNADAKGDRSAVVP